MRRRFTLGLIPGIALTLLSPLAQAGEHDAAAWLERMIRSAHQLNYTGTFVYQQDDGSLQSMKIIHAVNDSGERERLISLTGPSREVVRDRERVTCILPEDEPIVVEHTGTPRPFPVTLPRELEPLRDYYSIRLEGEERVAGLPARKVVIAPRDGYRYGQHFWLAADSGLLLRADVVNEEGKIVEQVMFTSLEVHEQIPASMLEPEQKGDSRVVELQRKPEPPAVPGKGTPLWRVADLPPGFSQQLQRNHYLPEKKFPVEHHVYSDGLASVSVFIEKREEDTNAFIGASSMGGVNAYGRVLDSHTVTVLGEVPPLTVERIARSLEKVEP